MNLPRQNRAAPLPHRNAAGDLYDRHAGFTLVELALVAAIVAVISAIAVPRFVNASTRYRVEHAARRVVADLELARSRAMEAGASRSVSFDLASDTVTLSGVGSINLSSQPYVTELRREPYGVDLTAASFGGSSQVVFDGFGRPSSGGTITLNCGGNMRQIVLNRDTEKAKIQ